MPSEIHIGHGDPSDDHNAQGRELAAHYARANISGDAFSKQARDELILELFEPLTRLDVGEEVALAIQEVGQRVASLGGALCEIIGAALLVGVPPAWDSSEDGAERIEMVRVALDEAIQLARQLRSD